MSRHRRGHGERGGVIVEAAIIIPLLFGLIFGVLEIGSVLKSHSGAANAVRAGGRMASVAGNLADADRLILERIAEEAAGIPNGEIEYVVIWHASAKGEKPPASCTPPVAAVPNQTSVGVTDGGPTVNAIGACNVYHRPAAPGGAFDMAQGLAAQPAAYYYGCTGASDAGASHKVDCNWAARNRRTTISPRGELPVVQPDYIGVHIRAKHGYVTGILGSEVTITDNSVNLLEPQGYNLSG